MAELLECVNAITFEAGVFSDKTTYSGRVVFENKIDPTFNKDLLTDSVVINEASDLEGKTGTIFLSTKDPTLYKSGTFWFNSFANKKVGNVYKRYENIVAKLGSYNGYEILFRPSGTILNESTEWIFYRMSEKNVINLFHYVSGI